MRKWVCLFCLFALCPIASADRFPIVRNNFPVDVILNPVGSTNADTVVQDDTMIFTMTTHSQLFYSDTNVSITNKNGIGLDTGLFLAAGQYVYDFSTYLSGDTLVARCLTCPAGETTTVRIRYYPAGSR